MKYVQSRENGSGGVAKGLAEHNEPKEDEKKTVKGGVVGEGQGRSNEGAFRDMVRPPTDAHRVQPQPQGQTVCWERFLPVRSLKVLLVESDDSTRHVVSALLRNCSYEVTAVSNGIEAWKILEDLDNQIDLVLTEVVMSGISGIGLLSKIMTHKSCRNIPVIMMSCYDSMGIVLKCLSKGAADFLVKPIRKNELKNLWQHVWRRCHSSSGSGSESAVGNEKSMTAKNAHESDNGTGSNDEDDSRSLGGSDHGSGTQSSWTKRAAEADSPQPPSLWDQLADPTDSTCAQAICPRSEAFASSWVPASLQDRKGHNNQQENVSIGKDLEIGIARNTEPHPKAPIEKASVSGTEVIKSSELDLNLANGGEKLDNKLDISNDTPKEGIIKQAVNLPGVIRSDEHSRGSAGSQLPAVLPEIPKNKEKYMENVQELPSLGLSLNRLGDCAETSNNVSEKNILRHSELSAFTRYNTCSTANQGLTGNVGSCSPADNSSEAAKKPNSNSMPNQNSNSSSNNNDMGSTTNRSFTKPDTEKTPETSILRCSNHTSAFQPADKGPSKSELRASAKATLGPINGKLQENDKYPMTDIQLQQQYCNRSGHSMQKAQLVAPHADFSLKSTKRTTTEGGSLNSKGVLAEANTVNRSGNESVCGSNHGSNTNNGGAPVVNAERKNMVNGFSKAANDCTDNGSGSGSGVGTDQNRSAHREAALNKFRQKRKERCFDKKVRYQSRKKLAEQRPRVRGQFIKQMQDSKGEDADS
ncbi:hypothetical protein RND81_08G178100 [Saponaria officinalis]|uniref:Uncharacterized protein n=1 Tax=Saponaria officinalis TaxID=3572 RepID=A0AAW1J9E4_SAPOF